MKRNNSWFVLALVLLSATAQAGGDGCGTSIGNGGNVLICETPDHRVQSPRLFDLVEESSSVDPILWGRSAQGTGAVVGVVLERLKRLDAPLAYTLERSANLFMTEARWLPIALPQQTYDQGDLLQRYPSCRLVQLVIQDPCAQPGSPRYVVDASLWGQLAPLDQAATILHEILLRHRIEKTGGALRDTWGVRQMTRLLSSPSLVNLSADDYAALAYEYGF